MSALILRQEQTGYLPPFRQQIQAREFASLSDSEKKKVLVSIDPRLVPPEPEFANENSPGWTILHTAWHQGSELPVIRGRQLQPPEPQPPKPWWERRTFTGMSSTGPVTLKRSLVITPDERIDLHEAWFFSQVSWLQSPTLVLNAFLTLRPGHLDDMDPIAREAYWDSVINHLRVTCRDKGFRFTAIMTRESLGDDGHAEHLHVLMHIPPGLFGEIRDLIEGKVSEDGVVIKRGWRGSNKLKPAHYSISIEDGKRAYALGYLCKAADPKNRRADAKLWYRPSGPVFGWRTKLTTNLRRRNRLKADPDILAKVAHRCKLTRIGKFKEKDAGRTSKESHRTNA